MPPLKEGPVFDGRCGRHDVTGERTVARISTRSLAVRLPRNFSQDNDFAGIDVGRNHALRPTVTRLPDRLMEPSTRPSM